MIKKRFSRAKILLVIAVNSVFFAGLFTLGTQTAHAASGTVQAEAYFSEDGVRTIDNHDGWVWTDGHSNETGPAGTTGVTPGNGWEDSYSTVVDGVERCFITSNSTLDHGAEDLVVNTPDGDKTVREIYEDMGTGPGVGENPVYNDIQCGNGPANDAGDEDWDQCPGRVDMGASGCGVIGPLWGLEIVYAD